MRWIDMVGRRFTGWDHREGANCQRTWVCTKYTSNAGLYLRTIDDLGPPHEICISERAVERTFYRIKVDLMKLSDIRKTIEEVGLTLEETDDDYRILDAEGNVLGSDPFLPHAWMQYAMNHYPWEYDLTEDEIREAVKDKGLEVDEGILIDGPFIPDGTIRITNPEEHASVLGTGETIQEAWTDYLLRTS